MPTPPETPLLLEQKSLGAAMGMWFGTPLPETYGDTPTEYRRARTTAALVDTNFQLFAEFTGPDRVRYLNAVSTGNVRDLEPGRSVVGLLLNPQGHILAELRTLALDDRLIVLSHAMVSQRTLETFDKYIIMDDVAFTDCTAATGYLSVVGPAAPAAMEELTGAKLDTMAPGEHVETRIGEIACRLLSASPLGLGGFELLAARERLADLWRLCADATARHGGGPAGYAAVNALRLENGVAWFGADYDDRVIPHEAGLEQSHISDTKGCYTGQEIVERVRSRGQVNRRRLGLAFSGTTVPQAGAKLAAQEKDAGWVTSAADSPMAGRIIGMGYLRREFHAVGSRVEWQGGTAEVIALPLGS